VLADCVFCFLYCTDQNIYEIFITNVSLERIVIDDPPQVGVLTFFKNNDLFPLSTFDFTFTEVIIIVPTV